MDTKPMPGPWEFDPQDTHFAFCGQEKRPAANPDYDFRVEFSDHVHEDEVDATLHLIAAAPELYDALKGCHAAMDMLFARLIDARVLAKISDMPEFAKLIAANKALAKAQGRTP